MQAVSENTVKLVCGALFFISPFPTCAFLHFAVEMCLWQPVISPNYDVGTTQVTTLTGSHQHSHNDMLHYLYKHTITTANYVHTKLILKHFHANMEVYS